MNLQREGNKIKRRHTMHRFSNIMLSKAWKSRTMSQLYLAGNFQLSLKNKKVI